MGWRKPTGDSKPPKPRCDFDVRAGLSTEDFLFDYLALQRCLFATWVTDVLGPLKTLAFEDPELAARIASNWHTFAISMNARTNKPPAVRKFMVSVVRGLQHGALRGPKVTVPGQPTLRHLKIVR